MQRVAQFTLGWLAAALVAVGLAWAVISDVVDDPTTPAGHDAAARTAGPRTSPTTLPPPVTSVPRRPPAVATSEGRHTATPAPDSTARASSGRPRPTPPAPPPASSTASSAAASSSAAVPPSASDADVRSYRVAGGQVVLHLLGDRAELVSATPTAGFTVQDWTADGWLRVDFTGSAARSSVFATWNGHPPQVQTVEY